MVLVAGGLVLGACARAEPPPPRPEVSVEAARVEHPLDARGLRSCEILPALDAARIDIDPRTARDESNAIASVCLWQSLDRAMSIRVILNVDYSIEVMFGSLQAAEGRREYEIRGYPAVRESPEGASLCAVHVAIAESQVFTVEATSSRPEPSVRPCESAESAAGAVVDAIAARG